MIDILGVRWQIEPMSVMTDESKAICQDLLRMNTTNPPGDEEIAARYLANKLAEVGIASEFHSAGERRTNIVARIPGTGKKAPLLLSAHLDVVEADETKWKYPPFSGIEAEGCLWGRGAIDMKNMAAMICAIMREFARQRISFERDIIFAGVADEEAGCDCGSRFLVEKHRTLVEAEYAIGESGGFSLHLGSSTFYPIQVAEKGFCWVRATLRGEPGHGSMPRADSVITRLGEALTKIGNAKMPVHPTKYVADFVAALREQQPALVQPLLRLATQPQLLARIARLLPHVSASRTFGALLSNTASATVVRAGSKTNVIPGVASFDIDGRTLPGQTDEQFIAELRAVLGPDVELEIIKSAPPVVTEPVQSPVYEIISRNILAREPDAVVVPYMIPGFTDAKYFSQTGAKWYGFSPVKIEKSSGIRFADMFHGHNERVPVAGLAWGTEVLCDVVREVACAAK